MTTTTITNARQTARNMMNTLVTLGVNRDLVAACAKRSAEKATRLAGTRTDALKRVAQYVVLDLDLAVADLRDASTHPRFAEAVTLYNRRATVANGLTQDAKEISLFVTAELY